MGISKKDKIAIANFHKRRSAGVLASKALYEPKDSKEKMKMNLCEAIIVFKKSEGLTQKNLASLSRLTEPQISEVMNYRIEKFTIDFLLDIVDKVNSCKKVGPSKNIKCSLSVED